MVKEEGINILSELFNKKYNSSPSEVTRLAGAGSGRCYYRMSDGSHHCIGVIGENKRDCDAFTNLSKIFRNEGIFVPEVYGSDDSGLFYIQEDLGDCSLFNLIMKNKERSDSSASDDYSGITTLIEEAMRQLARMQCVDEKKWETEVEYKPFSIRQILWDLNYFKYEFCRPLGYDMDEELLEDDFERFSMVLFNASEKAKGFIYRDFQSRNVMVKDGHCAFIDFQAGRVGPVLYDPVSFLWQAKAGFSDSFRKKMLDIYSEEYSELREISRDELLKPVDSFVLFRTLQVLGAYGLRGLIEKKAHFVESIPSAVSNLHSLLDNGVLDSYPELKALCAKIVDDKRFAVRRGSKDWLTIEIFSFSYKKGYPDDLSGNGGGFMFDCRGMHNPGRYREYKSLTGMDEPVIEFLKKQGEADRFSDNAITMVSPTVERYVKRGFENLQIGFGCTGGQHRSVYCAEKVAHLLSIHFPNVEIRVFHREQGVSKILNQVKD